MLQSLDRAISIFPASAFKPNGIYGIAPGLINAAFAHRLGLALGSLALEGGAPAIVVGRDCRLNGVELVAALQAGLRAAGIKVIDIGMATTPLAYFAAHACETGAAICVTGGHLPSAYNGFNIMLQHRELSGADLADVQDRMNRYQALIPAPGAGTRMQTRMDASYIARILGEVSLSRPMKIAVDCGNGMAGPLVTTLLHQLGCSVTELFCDMDGDFPNHVPDPADSRNLQDLIYCLRYSDCELGLAFDGDGDRLVVVTKSGNIIRSDQLLILFGRELLERHPGGRIVHDVQSSRHLPREIQAAGGTTTMWKTGRACILARMEEEDAFLGGDTCGHLIFKDRWYGFSDGVYAAARLLEVLSREASDGSCLLDTLPSSCATPELRALTGAADPVRLIQSLCDVGKFTGAEESIETEGLRIEYADGFGLARASNSTSALVFQFEADNRHALTRIQTEFRKQLRRVAPRLQLPF